MGSKMIKNITTFQLFCRYFIKLAIQPSRLPTERDTGLGSGAPPYRQNRVANSQSLVEKMGAYETGTTSESNYYRSNSMAGWWASRSEIIGCTLGQAIALDDHRTHGSYTGIEPWKRKSMQLL